MLLVAVLPATLAAHPRTFPLGIPDRSPAPNGTLHPLTDHWGRQVPPETRTRVVERAVAKAGGWTRWRELGSLWLRYGRRSFDALGEPLDRREETLRYHHQGLHRYWEQDGALWTAGTDGRQQLLISPDLAPGDPDRIRIQEDLERDLFWIAHPFLLYRPGIRTRHLGATMTRGTRCEVLLAEFAPGAAPYRKVEYHFDRALGDLVKATAHPSRTDRPVEVYHFSGRIAGTTGLRLPRRRELLRDGVVREVVTTLDLATRPFALPPAPTSAEARLSGLPPAP